MASADVNDSFPPPSPSRRVFVFGAGGGVGRRLTAALTARGDTVTGLHHAVETAAAITDAGGEPVQVDLATVTAADLTTHVAGHDAIVFCAGAGAAEPDLVDVIDGRGPGKAAAAAARAGVDRFVLVSVFMDAWRGNQSPGTDFERFISAKRRADVDLVATDLDWLIVRPGTLSDGPGTGRVRAGAALAYDEIPRDDVAAFIATAIRMPFLSRVAIEITAGDTPIASAIATLEPRKPQLVALPENER